MQGDEEAPQQQSEMYTGNHKKTALMHVIFKVAVFFMYLMGKLVMSNFVLCFVIMLLLSAADFWVVKNVTGRVLVGLRWWNMVRENGESEWVFESVSDRKQVHAVDSTFFWAVLFGYVLLWLGVAFFNMFDPKWLVAILVPLSCSVTNAYGYAKCRKDWKKQGASLVMKHAQENPEMAMSAMTTVAGAAASAPQAAPPPSQNWGNTQ